MMPEGLLENVHPVTIDGKKCREFVALEFSNEVAARVFESKVADSTPYNKSNVVVIICQIGKIIRLSESDLNSKTRWKEAFQREYQEEYKTESAEEVQAKQKLYEQLVKISS